MLVHGPDRPECACGNKRQSNTPNGLEIVGSSGCGWLDLQPFLWPRHTNSKSGWRSRIASPTRMLWTFYGCCGKRPSTSW